MKILTRTFLFMTVEMDKWTPRFRNAAANKFNLTKIHKMQQVKVLGEKPCQKRRRRIRWSTKAQGIFEMLAYILLSMNVN